MFKKTCDLVSGSPLTSVINVSSLMSIDLLEVEILSFLLCYRTSSDHIIKGNVDFISRYPIIYVTTLPSLMLIGFAEVEI